jgi:hypothetical protein
MKNIQLNLPTALALAAVVGAGAFAAGQATAPASTMVTYAAPLAAPPMQEPEGEGDQVPEDPLPPGHPAAGDPGARGATSLPPGHPPIDPTGPMDPGSVAAGGAAGPTGAGEAPIDWKAPARWQPAANASSMRIATYKVPHAPGDRDDAEVSVVQAGGSVDANAARWIGQFDAGGQKTAKRGTRRVGTLEVTTVDVQGTYSGGMGADSSPREGWALRGAIVALPSMPLFFKLIGPAKTVSAAGAEFDTLVASIVPRAGAAGP